MREKGVLETSGKFRSQRFVHEFASYFADLEACAAFGSYLTKSNVEQIAWKLRRGAHSVISPTERVLLGHWVFGSWGLWVEYCLWRASLDQSTSCGQIASTLAANDNEDLLAIHREVCKAFIARFPDGNRSVFWRRHRRSCLWLTKHDRAWLDAHLKPEIPAVRQQMSLPFE